MPPHVLYDPTGIGRGAGGGALIGLAAALLLGGSGQTLGVSSVVGGLVRDGVTSAPWRAALVAGMLLAGGVVTAAFPADAVFGPPLALHWVASLVGGVAVGLGTRLGSGCTSGHGVCGLPRGSPRSLAAVCVFMGAGVLAAGLSRAPFARAGAYPGGDGAGGALVGRFYVLPMIGALLAAAALQRLRRAPPPAPAGAAAAAVAPAPADAAAEPAARAPPAPPPPPPPGLAARLAGQAYVFAVGLLFGLALALSGMADPLKVLRFLDFAGDDGWDPQLGFVMAAAVCVNLPASQLLARRHGAAAPPLFAPVAAGGGGGKHPPTFAKLLPLWTAADNMRFDGPLLCGAALFGLGWGLVGVCPGPGIVAFASGTSGHFSIVAAGAVLGMALYEACAAAAAAAAERARP